MRYCTSSEFTHPRLYAAAVAPRIAFEVAPGDVVQAGVVVSNSEVGCGKLSVQPLVYRLVCGNGLIASMVQKTHVGRALDSEKDSGVVFKDDTLRADHRAFFLKARDVVDAAVFETMLRLAGEKLRQTMHNRLSGDPAQAVEVLVSCYGLDDSESSSALRDLVQGGELSGYALVNAVTRYQQVADYDRATGLEVLGDRLLELPATEWRTPAQAA